MGRQVSCESVARISAGRVAGETSSFPRDSSLLFKVFHGEWARERVPDWGWLETHTAPGTSARKCEAPDETPVTGSDPRLGEEKR